MTYTPSRPHSAPATVHDDERVAEEVELERFGEVLPHHAGRRRAMTSARVGPVDDERHAGVLEHVHRCAVGALEHRPG